jgi:hypothetical protein
LEEFLVKEPSHEDGLRPRRFIAWRQSPRRPVASGRWVRGGRLGLPPFSFPAWAETRHLFSRLTPAPVRTLSSRPRASPARPARDGLPPALARKPFGRGEIASTANPLILEITRPGTPRNRCSRWPGRAIAEGSSNPLHRAADDGAWCGPFFSGSESEGHVPPLDIVYYMSQLDEQNKADGQKLAVPR